MSHYCLGKGKEREVMSGITYHYKERGDYPYNGKKLEDSLARHHIISYPHMYEFGVIVLAYFQILYNEDRLEQDECFKKFSQYYNISNHLVTGILKKRKEYKIFDYEKEAKGVLNQIAWTQANIFVGPAGKYRCDDPEQGKDGIPLSMRNSFSPKIQSIRSNKGIPGSPAMQKGSIGNIAIGKTEICNIGKIFMNALPETRNLHNTKVGDWAAVQEIGIIKNNPGSNNQRNGNANNFTRGVCYPIFFKKSNSRSDQEKETFGFKLRLKNNKNNFCSSNTNKEKICNEKIVVILRLYQTRNDYFVEGIIKKKGAEHEWQQDDDIAVWMENAK